MNNTTQVQQVPATRSTEVEYVPYGGQDPIKLSVAIIRNYVAIPTKSGKLPDDRECIRFLMLCKSRRLNPFEGDCFLQGYDSRDGVAQFSLITAHQAFLKRAEHHPEYDGMQSGVIVIDESGALVNREGDFTLEEDKLVGAWATVFFKERKVPMNRRLRLSTFRKPFGRWPEGPAGMIVKCAEADALRSSFPTLLGGLYSAEEVDPGQLAAAAAPRLADISDLAQVPAKTTVAAPQQPASKPAAAKGPATPPKTAESQPETPLCAYCGQPMSASHSCAGLEAAIAATEGGKSEATREVAPEATPEVAPDPSQKEITGTPAEQEAAEAEERKKLIASINHIMGENELSLQDVTKFLVSNRIAKPNQKMVDLNTTKLRSFNRAIMLPATIEEIKGLAAK